MTANDPKRQIALVTSLAEARALMRGGQFDDALAMYERICVDAPLNGAAHMALAALRAQTGDPEGGHAAMTGFYRRTPLLRGSEGADSVLVRGFEHTYVKLGNTDTGLKPKLQGGHYTTATFLKDYTPAPHRLTLVPGAGVPDDLPPVRLLINTIAEPDIEPTALDTLEAYLDAHPDLAVINHPARVRDTTRDRNFQRLSGIDHLTFPRTLRLTFENASEQDLRDALIGAGMRAPFILRPVGTQTGRGVVLMQRPEDLAAFAQQPVTGSYYAIAFHNHLWRGTHYRKMRLFWIDGAYYPVVCYLDTYWNVHGARKIHMKDDPELMAEERRFLDDWQGYVGPNAHRALMDAAHATGMEFFGVDFTLDDDGNVVIYELNAAMRHHYSHLENFPYKAENDKAITRAYQAMVTARRSQTAPPNPAPN